jgi:RNA polymerase sigma factor for flagellar operon FliA
MKAARSLAPAALVQDLAHGPVAPPVTAEDIKTYLPLVRQVVARFLRKLPPNVLRDDLMAAGTFGLIDSLRKNGQDRSPTFEWYARIRIRGAILDELRAQDWLTRRARSRVTASAVEGQSGRAVVIGFDDLTDAGRQSLLDQTTPSPLEIVEGNAERAALAEAVGQLLERERLIVTLHYFQGVQFKTIAAQLGVSEPRVSQLHSRAMAKLKAILVEAGREDAAA